MGNKNQPRVYYIDNLRIFLICLVVLHHFAITYGAPGDWYYMESEAGFPEIVPMAMFRSTNQAFFMGMFFFISAYFLIPSLERKGMKKFVIDKLLRLALPTLFFYLFLHPLTVFIRDRFIYGNDVVIGDYFYPNPEFGFGPMWFVEALIIFTFGFLLWKGILKRPSNSHSISFPSTKIIILFALLIGIGQFLIRIWLPVGWAMPFTNFQFPHFLQYIFLFILGIIAFEQKWLDQISVSYSKNWFIAVQLFIFIGFPIVFIFGGAMEGDTTAFLGGLTWQNMAYALWEQFVGFGMIVALFGIFKMKLNNQGPFAKRLSSSAYAVYVFHTTILVGLAFLFLNLDLPQFWKFVILSPVALIVSFVVASLVKKIPFIGRKVL